MTTALWFIVFVFGVAIVAASPFVDPDRHYPRRTVFGFVIAIGGMAGVFVSDYRSPDLVAHRDLCNARATIAAATAVVELSEAMAGAATAAAAMDGDR